MPSPNIITDCVSKRLAAFIQYPTSPIAKSQMRGRNIALSKIGGNAAKKGFLILLVKKPAAKVIALPRITSKMPNAETRFEIAHPIARPGVKNGKIDGKIVNASAGRNCKPLEVDIMPKGIVKITYRDAMMAFNVNIFVVLNFIKKGKVN